MYLLHRTNFGEHRRTIEKENMVKKISVSAHLTPVVLVTLQDARRANITLF